MKKLLFLVLLLAGIVLANAQGVKMLNALQSSGVYPTADTVVNAATATLGLKSPGVGVTTSVQCEITKISGTLGGTVSLYGSNDGVNYRSISSTTFTPTDVASQGFIWQLTGSPLLYYRINYLGVSGPMSASFTGTLYKH